MLWELRPQLDKQFAAVIHNTRNVCLAVSFKWHSVVIMRAWLVTNTAVTMILSGFVENLNLNLNTADCWLTSLLVHLRQSIHCIGVTVLFLYLFFSCVAVYQASISGLCDGTCRSVSLSVCWSVCPQSVLWQNGWVDLDAVWDGEWGRSTDGCIRWVWLSSKERGSFGGEFWASNCN